MSPTRLGLLTLSTSVGSGYEFNRFIPIGFSWAPRIDRTLLTEGYSCIHLILTITVLLRFRQLNRTTILLDISRSVPYMGLTSPYVLLKYWIINQFPFRSIMLTLTLGSTNSRLTTHCLETLALSAIGILTRLCCYYHRDLQSLHGPQEVTPLLPPMRDAFLPQI